MKEVLIAVTGSIAAYKTCDLVRELSKQKVPVRVLMSPHAKEFVTPLTFEALSNQKVWIDEYESGMPHITLKNVASVFAIVPATANTIGKMANGIADEIVTSTYLACTCPVLVAPAMNPGMWSHAAVQRNIQKLREDRVIILDPTEGEVVCGDVGRGKLAPTNFILEKILEIHNKQ